MFLLIQHMMKTVWKVLFIHFVDSLVPGRVALRPVAKYEYILVFYVILYNRTLHFYGHVFATAGTLINFYFNIIALLAMDEKNFCYTSW